MGLERRGEVVQGDARRYLQGASGCFDLVFLDPPFADRLLSEAARCLEQRGLLSAGAWIYLEQDGHRPWPELPATWRLHREGRAGQAAFRLMQRNG
ncbi:MAG: hypothetical protein D6720_03960 [Gammaproteobacteria bacterium]|nr:MAG: hypothetical protein D6720_03960 [Gammaproteobacteria bacterium]